MSAPNCESETKEVLSNIFSLLEILKKDPTNREMYEKLNENLKIALYHDEDFINAWFSQEEQELLKHLDTIHF